MKKNLYIAIGGMLGASLRYGIKTEMGSYLGKFFPVQTLFSNVLGCFLIAIVLTAAFEYLEIDVDLRLGIATGFLGALTTFSTLCKEVYLLFEAGQWMTSIVYMLSSIGLGFIAIYAGVITTRILFGHKQNEESELNWEEGDER